MNGNKLLTGFLVLGMGLSLVACSSDKPEPKKERGSRYGTEFSGLFK